MVGGRSEPPPAAVGARALLALRISAVLAAVVCFGWGAITAFGGDPDPPFQVWVLPVVTALVVLILCRDPSLRVPELSYTIFAAAWLGLVISGLAFLVGVDPFFTVMFCLCVVTLTLSHLWRGEWGRVN